MGAARWAQRDGREWGRPDLADALVHALADALLHALADALVQGLVDALVDALDSTTGQATINNGEDAGSERRT